MKIPSLALVILWGLRSMAQAAASDTPVSLELTVDGTARTALVHVPAAPAGGKLPVVFVFHGHGGTSQSALSAFPLDRLWPEAVAVYPQGLNTPGPRTDPEGNRPGWQRLDDQRDRDLHFFDALLARLRKDYPVDDRRIYVTGHSNGAGFAYLLWYKRPQVFAAVAASSGGAPFAARLPPKPAMILAGESDQIVSFNGQKRVMGDIQEVNKCETKGQPWEGKGMLYPSKSGTPVVTLIHPGGHRMDPASPALIVKFFQQHAIP